MSDDLPPIMTTEEVADFFRTCIETVRSMERAGEIEAIPGRRRVTRYSRKVVLALLDDKDK